MKSKFHYKIFLSKDEYIFHEFYRNLLSSTAELSVEVDTDVIGRYDIFVQSILEAARDGRGVPRNFTQLKNLDAPLR